MIHKIYKVGDNFAEADLVGGVKVQMQHITEDTQEIAEEIDLTPDEEKKLKRLTAKNSRAKVLNDIINIRGNK